MVGDACTACRGSRRAPGAVVKRIVVANEYDLARNVERYQRGEYARHLLFGVQSLPGQGWSVRLAGEGGRHQVLRRRALRTALTNLRALVLGLRADVVYATFNDGALLCGLARRLLGRPRRVVTIIHGVPPLLLRYPRLFAVLYGGHDALLFLSPTHHARLAPALPASQLALWTPWGPGSEWRRAAVGEAGELTARQGYALVIGKSKRDWSTLMAAQDLARFPLVVVGGADCPLPPRDDVVVYRPAEGREALALRQVQDLYRAAGCVVLPLVEDDSLNGLTSLGEALASGAPTVLTGTRAMRGFADVYAGRLTVVPPGDAQALADAVVGALMRPPATLTPGAPTAEAFERVLHDILG